jgi:hypothetical protein
MTELYFVETESTKGLVRVVEEWKVSFEWQHHYFKGLDAHLKGLFFDWSTYSKSSHHLAYSLFLNKWVKPILMPWFDQFWEVASQGDLIGVINMEKEWGKIKLGWCADNSSFLGEWLLKQIAEAKSLGLLGKYIVYHKESFREVDGIVVWGLMAQLFQLEKNHALRVMLHEDLSLGQGRTLDSHSVIKMILNLPWSKPFVPVIKR